MKTKSMSSTYMVLAVLIIGISNVWAAELTEHGQKLEEQYAEQLETLKTEIKNSVPKVAEERKNSYQEALEAEKNAKAAVEDAKKTLGEVKRAKGLVRHAKGKWIGEAEKGIAKAKEKLKNAKTEAKREEARKELTKWQQNKEDGLEALKERQARLDEAERKEPQWSRELTAAENDLAEAKANAMQAFKELGLEPFLTSDKLDAKLAKFIVLFEATPRGLAEFAQQGKEQEELISKMLAYSALMWHMAVADGAKEGKYGQAIKIYNDILHASKKARKGTLHRLALAISLEHAVPISQRNPKADKDAPQTVDPVNRYLHYEKAFLNDELDPAFKDLSIWDYRMVVNGNEPDETLAWGREMLRSYRPDHIMTDDYRWRYVALVRTDIKYGSQYNKYDKPELQFFQNILMNGGVCGRRAFIGRFILRAFGIPSIARPSRGHGALAHWTPDGWVVCLGGGWGAGWTKTRYKDDLDFLATTQARKNREAYLQVKRAQWVGDVLGEKRTFGLRSEDPDFWYGVSLYRQRAIIEEEEAEVQDAVGEELGEANESEVKHPIVQVELTEEDKGIDVDRDGVITIPAAATSKPTKSTGKIIFMPSNLGGKQLHYSRSGKPQKFEYTFDVPESGTYALTARIANPSWGQHLLVATNGKEPIDIELPLTVALWDETEPVELELSEGKNVLTFSRGGENIRGLSIKEFTLTPVAE